MSGVFPVLGKSRPGPPLRALRGSGTAGYSSSAQGSGPLPNS